MKYAVFGIFFSLYCALAANAQGTIKNALIPYQDPAHSGMAAAKKKFLFLQNAEGEGVYRFITLAEYKLRAEPDFFNKRGWAYMLVQEVFDQLALEKINPNKKSATFSEDVSSDNASPTMSAAKLYPWMADPSSSQYRDFYGFVSEQDAAYRDIPTAIRSYLANLAMAQEESASQSNLSLKNASGTTTADFIERRRLEAESEAARRQEGNSRTGQNAAAAREQARREREAAAGRTTQTVIVY